MRPRRPAIRPLCPKRVSLLVAHAMLLWLASSSAQAGIITLDGSYWSDPWHATPFPAGDIHASGVKLGIGADGSDGSFALHDGAYALLGSVSYGVGGNGRGLINGANTALVLDGLQGRLTVGGHGSGTLTLMDGATINAAVNAAACRQADAWCGLSIAGSAGASGSFTLSGAGTSASFLHGVDVGNVYRDVNWGTTGGHSSGSLQIDNGAKLTSERANVADSLNYGPLGQGYNESTSGTITIRGEESSWTIANFGTNDQPSFMLGYGARSSAWLKVSDGALLAIVNSGQSYSGLTIGTRGAQASAWVSNGGTIAQQAGAGQGAWNIGQDGGNGTLTVSNGGKLVGGHSINIGSNGGTGVLSLSGAASSALFGDGAYLDVGNRGTGTLQVSNGAQVSTGVLNVGLQGGQGTVVLSGAGTRLSAGRTDSHRLNIADGSVTVSNGAVLDATQNTAACLNVWCGNGIATSAGQTGSLTVSGAGSRVSLLDTLNVGGRWVTAPPATDYTDGVPGGISRATLKVLNGGVLESQYAVIGSGINGPSADGTEQVYASVLLQGAGSRWTVSGNALNGNSAWFDAGIAGGGGAIDLRVLDGAQLALGAADVNNAHLNLGSQGGYTSALISGANSRISFASAYSYLDIGRDGGNASVSFTRGGRLENANQVNVGSQGGIGALTFDGVGSGASASLDTYAYYFIGDNGYGRMTVSNGAVVNLHSQDSFLQVGGGWGELAGNGALLISGAGSQVSLSSPQTASAEYHYNPYAAVGLRGSGQLTISNGGLLSLTGNDSNGDTGTGLIIGHSLDGNYRAPANGVVTVTGAGSRLAVNGVDAFVEVGRATQGNGQLNVLNGGRVDSTVINVAEHGATGRLLVDSSTVALTGQWRDGRGAALTAGSGSGSSGSIQLRNGSTLTIDNQGSGGVHLLLGANGGTGELRLSGGSAITLNAAAGLAQVEINGASSATLNASSLSAAGGNIYVGGGGNDRASLLLENNSELSAAYIGVGTRNGADGGTATLIVNDSTVNADTLEIGAHGYVGGNGTLLANVINRGVFNPGNSPGTLVVGGNFITMTGGQLVLEVEADGAGGYNIDHLLFLGGSQLDFTGLKVSFHFLGATDPTAFQNSGLFDIDNFIAYADDSQLAHSLFAATSFVAESDHYTFSSFSFSADGGADFSVAAVPEPETYALMLAGLGLIGWRLRRKS